MEEKITVRAQKIVKNRTKFKMIVFGGLAVLVILIASLAPYLTPYDPYEQNLSIALQPPGASHLLGTDRYGRDMLSRVIIGSQTTIFSALLLVAALGHVMQDIPLDEIDRFEDRLLAYMEEQAPDLCHRIEMTGQLSQEDREEILQLAREFLETFQSGGKRGG